MIGTMMVVIPVMAIVRLRIRRNRKEGDDSQEHHFLHTKLRCLPGSPAQAFIVFLESRAPVLWGVTFRAFSLLLCKGIPASVLSLEFIEKFDTSKNGLRAFYHISKLLRQTLKSCLENKAKETFSMNFRDRTPGAAFLGKKPCWE
jgi:hypothetical protein